MTGQSDQPQNPSDGKERPQVYSVSQDKDGSYHFSRRNFLYLSAAVGGTLVLKSICPRFGAKATPSTPVQASISNVYVHTKPNIASSIADTLKPNDLVRLISDYTELGWVEVATQDGKNGWVDRSFVDFSRAVKSNSPDFELNDVPPLSPVKHLHSKVFSVHLNGTDTNKELISESRQPSTCGEIIQNGEFEDGQVSWVEYTTGTIVTNAWSDPYQGSWVAWFGGISAVERLTQLFHVPINVQDVQRIYFYMKVTSEDPFPAVNDTFWMRFLDGAGNPITGDIPLANNTDRTDWGQYYVELTGMTSMADQDMQIQFEAVLNDTYITNFVIDQVSLDLQCDPLNPSYYIYIPVIINSVNPPSTPTPSPTPCPSYNPCPTDCATDCGSDCPFDCSSDCSYDCTYDCGSDCTFECIYDCPFDCVYYCGYDW